MRSIHFLSTALFVATIVTNTRAPCADEAPRAAYATVDELGGESTPHQASLSLYGKWLHLRDDARPSGLRNLATFGIRERTLVGRTIAYAAGIDLELGGSSTGFAYGGTLFPVGVGVRFGQGSTLSLSGGVGADAVSGSVPLAARFPAELDLAISLGPVRPTLWVRPAWTQGADERRHGSPSISRVDELEAGLTLRLGAQHRFWAEMNAGRGLSFGVVYRELMGARAIGAVLGLDFSGGQ